MQQNRTDMQRGASPGPNSRTLFVALALAALIGVLLFGGFFGSSTGPETTVAPPAATTPVPKVETPAPTPAPAAPDATPAPAPAPAPAPTP